MDSKDKLVTLEDLKVVHDEVARYTTCSTAASTAAKTAALTNFVLTTGSCVRVKFTNSNTAANPTLNVNSTGAKPIMQYGVTAVGTTPSESWNDGAVVEFVYDGTNWIISDAVSQNAIEIPVNADLDDYTIVGEYFCASSANAQTLSNCPVTASFNMIISKRSPNYVIQRIETGAALWTRTSSGSGWNGWHPFARADGDTFSGNITVDRANGTTSADGTSSIYLGNTTPTGTAGNSYGRVQIYGKGANYGVLLAQNVTADRELQFPDASGTVALEKARGDITSSAFTLSATGVTVNMNVCLKIGDMFSARLGFIKTDSSNFAQGRIFMGTLSNRAKPVIARYYIGAASNGVNSFVNRYVGVAIATDGTINIDNLFSSDVKQIYVCVDYMCADRT